MTEFAKELLEDVKPGDYVQLFCGVEIQGIVIKWSENILYIEKSDKTTAKILLNSLQMLNLIKRGASESGEGNVRETAAPLLNDNLVHPVQDKPAEYRVLRPLTDLDPGRSVGFSASEAISDLRKQLKACENSVLKKAMGGILDSLNTAVKNKEISYKYHNLRSRVLRIWDDCQSEPDYKIFYFALGTLAVIAGDYEYSLEPMVRAHKYTLAAYAAEKGNLTESAQVLSLCALLSGENPNIDQSIAEICTARKDPDVLETLLDLNKNDPDRCECIASCAYALFTASGGMLRSDLPLHCSAYDAAKQLLSSIPDGWRGRETAVSYWKEFQSYSYPKTSAEPVTCACGTLTGYVNVFNHEEKWGFISPNHYFYIKQVRDDSERGILLRKMLEAGLWFRLEVSFRIGESAIRPGTSAATSIELTENGYREALERSNSQEQKGSIDAYFPEYEDGRIRSSDGKLYEFKWESIIDPWLRAYYSKNFEPQNQDVTFDVTGKRAINIRWRNPPDRDRETYACYVSEAEINAWNLYVSGETAKKDNLASAAEDVYTKYPYVDLEEWESIPETEEDSPLTWGGKTQIGVEKQSRTQEAHLEPASKVFAKSDTGTAPVLTREARILAEQARKERIAGHLEQAAALFENALQAGGFDEKVLSDYITALQQIGRVDDALAILKMYERRLSETKLLNLKIGLYDKKKDYTALCPLYESAFQMAATVSTKSHNLIRLIDAYIKIEKYENALKACNQWETFYNQNRYSSDAEKLKKASPHIARHKAYCYYFLGHKKEAREIATSLLRTNPADAISNRILDNTLENWKVSAGADDTENALIIPSTDDFDGDGYDDWGDADFGDGQNESQSQFSRFVRHRIQQADIAASLKSPNIRDGRYIGSVAEGQRDVKNLLNRQGVTPKAKSDSFFAICKLLEQIEQNEAGKVNYMAQKVRFSGKAMAAWGDVMVSQARQLDSARMAYLYALKILTPIDGHYEQEWVDSYNRYIKSFFLAQRGSNSLEEYINTQTNRPNRDRVNTDIFVKNRIPEVLLHEFAVGMLLLTEAIGSQKNRQTTFLEELYSKNPELRNAICGQLRYFLNSAAPSGVSKARFCDMMRHAAVKLKEHIAGLNQALTDISNILMQERISTEQLNGLKPDQWKEYLTGTDYSRLRSIYYVVRRSQDYYSSGDFESRAECLRTVPLEVNELLQDIQNEPTDISYDIFLPALDQISLRLREKQRELYQTFLPKITIHETIQPSRMRNGKIHVRLTLENDLNYQAADFLRITKVEGLEIYGFEVTSPVVQSLRGGEETEIGLYVEIADSADASGSFDATVCFSYKCSDAPQNEITKSQSADFNFVIRNEAFEPLKNPFSAFEEKVMEDETMFFGRSTQIQQILDMIHTSDGGMNYGRAVAMYGQTRTGKTSLLYHLSNKLKSQYEDDLLIWDIGNLGEIDIEEGSAFMANFVYKLLDTGNEAIYRNKGLSNIVEESDLNPPLDQILEAPRFAVSLFNTYMRKLNEILRRERKLIILIADEFTYLHGYIKAGKIPQEFMRFWKALLQNNCIFAIIAGQDDMPEFMREYPNEFACMELLKLNYLAKEDAKQLIQKPLEEQNGRKDLFRNDGSVDEIYQLTAGSAYLTIILCSKLVSYLNEKGAYMVTKGIIADFLRTCVLCPNSFLMEKHFEPQIDERGHVKQLHTINEKILLSVARLSQAGGGYAMLSDITCGTLSRDEIQRYIDRLVDRNVLVKEGRDGYWIQVKLLEKWLINRMGA